MKVNREKFIDSIGYINNVNMHHIDIDLSEFFDVKSIEYKNRISEWKFTGLNIKDFIMMNDDIWIQRR